jgi:hypothetical protein
MYLWGRGLVEGRGGGGRAALEVGILNILPWLMGGGGGLGGILGLCRRFALPVGGGGGGCITP